MVLFDEIEKANDELHNVLLQVMEDGILTDGQGRRTDFRNTVIVMTSNIGAHRLAASVPSLGFAGGSPEECRREEVMAELKKHFRPEFLNRLDEVVLFHRLEQPHLEQIAARVLTGLESRLAALGVELKAPAAAVKLLAGEGSCREQGARPIRRAVRRRVEEPAASLLLERRLAAGDALCLSVEGEGLVLRPEHGGGESV